MSHTDNTVIPQLILEKLPTWARAPEWNSLVLQVFHELDTAAFISRATSLDEAWQHVIVTAKRCTPTDDNKCWELFAQLELHTLMDTLEIDRSEPPSKLAYQAIWLVIADILAEPIWDGIKELEAIA